MTTIKQFNIKRLKEFALTKTADTQSNIDMLKTLNNTAALATVMGQGTRPYARYSPITGASNHALMGTYNRDDSPSSFYESDMQREVFLPNVLASLGGGLTGALAGAGLGYKYLRNEDGTPHYGNVLGSGAIGGALGTALGGGIGSLITALRYNKWRTGKYIPNSTERIIIGKKLKEKAEKELSKIALE